MPAVPLYDELQLEIRKTPTGYQSRLSLPGFISDWCDSDSSLWNSAGGTPEWAGTADHKINGANIYRWLMQDNRMKTAWTTAGVKSSMRRIRLLLDSAAPELARVPWELMCDPETEAWIAGQVATPFSRLLVGGFDPVGPIADAKIRILVAISSPARLPAGFSPIPGEDFWKGISSALQPLVEIGRVDLRRLPEPVTLEALNAELMNGYHILHFVGHGSYGANGALLYLRSETANKDFVWADDFAGMVGRGILDVQNPGKPFLRMVTLASCQTAVSGAMDMFDSLAMYLGQQGLPAVLAMQDRVEMKTALEFTGPFYRRLLEHGLVDRAANEARMTLLTAQYPDAHVPVLFSRVKDNRLFEEVSLKFKEKLPFEPEMVLVDQGRFFMGASPNDPNAEDCEKDGAWIPLPAYWIGKYPVTNGEYAEFIQKTGRSAPDLNWEGQKPQAGKERCPVVGVTWYDAQAYCAWLADQTGRPYRLPSEAEWEKAARGSLDQRIYPWGDTFDPARCWHDSANLPQFSPQNPPQVKPVNSFAQGQYGCYDLIGNVREWTNTIWGEDLRPDKSRFPYPWAKDKRESHETDRSYFKVYRVLRGGGAGDDLLMLRCSARDRDALDARYQSGFRVARD